LKTYRTPVLAAVHLMVAVAVGLGSVFVSVKSAEIYDES